MGVLSCVGAVPGGKPFETFGKDLDNAQKAEARDDGPTGPATSTSPKGEIAETVRSAPGRDPRMARFIRVFSALASFLRRAEGFAAGRRVVLAFPRGSA